MQSMKHITKMMLIGATAISIATLTACRDVRMSSIKEADNLALASPDSAWRVLNCIDSTYLDADTRAYYLLTRALILDEQVTLMQCDTASCLYEDDMQWSFKREGTDIVCEQAAELDRMMADSLIVDTYNYYRDRSRHGVTRNRTDLVRFGRICYVMARHYTDNSDLYLSTEQLLLVSIHCAVEAGDHELAYRAYLRLGQHAMYSHSNYIMAYLCLKSALNESGHCRADRGWLLTMLNEMGGAYLAISELDPRAFTFIKRGADAAMANAINGNLCDSIAVLMDSVYATPPLGFSHNVMYTGDARMMDDADTWFRTREVGCSKGLFEDAMMTNDNPPSLVYDKMRQAERQMQSTTLTYLSSGYVEQEAYLQSRILYCVIIILVLVIVIIGIVVFDWRMGVKRKQEAEHLAQQAAMQQQAELANERQERMEEQLRLKDTLIATLRDHIIDKNQIFDMLQPTNGKRTVINASNWRDIETTLETADNRFVSRLRSEHPEFSEDDIRLCMLARLRLSNNALTSIYLVSVSAIQHRKQKLKKEGFGVTDPNITFDQIIAEY